MLDWIYEPPWRVVALVVGIITFAWGEWRGTRLVVRGLRSPGHPDQNFWLIRGVRAWIIGVALLSVGLGAYTHTSWAVLFGLVFLGEEMLEAATYLGVLRAARRREEREKR